MAILIEEYAHQLEVNFRAYDSEALYIYLRTLFSWIEWWQELYKLGAKKFSVLSVGAIGCVPLMRALDHHGNCVEEVNRLAQAFYAVISSLLQQFSTQFPGFTYSLGNLYDVTMTTILNSVVEGN